MYQSVFFDAYVYETSEIGDVGDDARQYHAFFQVLYRPDIWIELEYTDTLARVATRFLQLVHNVIEGR